MVSEVLCKSALVPPTCSTSCHCRCSMGSWPWRGWWTPSSGPIHPCTPQLNRVLVFLRRMEFMTPRRDIIFFVHRSGYPSHQNINNDNNQSQETYLLLAIIKIKTASSGLTHSFYNLRLLKGQIGNGWLIQFSTSVTLFSGGPCHSHPSPERRPFQSTTTTVFFQTKSSFFGWSSYLDDTKRRRKKEWWRTWGG